MAGPSAVPLVLLVAHLGIIPAMSHHYLRKHAPTSTGEAWKVGIAFALVGLFLDAAIIDLTLGWQINLFTTWITYAYFTLRLILAPITTLFTRHQQPPPHH